MSHDAQEGRSEATAEPTQEGRGEATPEVRQRGKYWWLRWVIIGVAVAVLAVEVVLVWDQLAKAWRSLLSANWWWVLASVFAALASMHSFAQIQRTLLKSAGVIVKQWRSESAFYAGNALSTTMPGGPVLSATFVYRQQRIWGASPMVASWQLVMSGVLQVVGLALLGLAGAFLLGASKNPLSLIFTLGGFVALLVLGQSVASNPQQIDGIGVRLLSWFNSVRGRPTDTGLAKWREMLRQLDSVSLSRRALGTAFSWSLFNWVADVACLAFAAYAAGGKPSLAGLTVAYAAARAVGSIPLMPGGLLVVEAVLVPGLVSSGMTLASAISAMLIYRLVSWIFISSIGWVVFFFMFRTEKDIDPDAPLDDDHGGDGAVAAQFSPDPEAVYEAEIRRSHPLSPDPEARHEPEPEP
ncbi:MAG: putative heme transporter [Mycobacterium sp.]|nr:putative heme transporter [Mycobacterium sp.]